MNSVCLTKALAIQPSLALQDSYMLPYVALYFTPFPIPVTFLAKYLTEGRVYSASQSEDTVHPGGKAIRLGARGRVRTQRRWISAASSFTRFTSAQDPSPWNGVAHS